MPRKTLQEIASADDGEIGGELLDWSGLSKMWHEQGLAGDYDFLRDVAEHCGSIDISTEQWGGDAPGLSGVWCRVSTRDPDKLRAEMQSRVQQLIDQAKSRSL
jgi:hypothetical protein